LRYIQCSNRIHINVVRMVEGVIKNLKRLKLPIFIDWRLSADDRNDAVASIEDQDHSVQAGNSDVVFEAAVGIVKFSDVAGTCSGHRNNPLQFTRERKPLQHFVTT